MELSSYAFPDVYKRLKVDTQKLGCIMADLDPLPGLDIVKKSMEDALYYSKEQEYSQGFVFDEPHLTLLYGLMTPGNEQPMKGAVDEVLEGLNLKRALIVDVDFFDSKAPGEDYYCLIARIAATEEIAEAHQRLQLLPHIDTFPVFKPHVSIAYIQRAKGETYRNEMLAHLRALWTGKTMYVKGINYGGEGK